MGSGTILTMGLDRLPWVLRRWPNRRRMVEQPSTWCRFRCRAWYPPSCCRSVTPYRVRVQSSFADASKLSVLVAVRVVVKKLQPLEGQK